MNRYNINKGKWGERIASEYLMASGFTIREMNFSCKAGEIDIIAEKGNEIHFIEVKARKDEELGNPLEAITQTKLRHVMRAAEWYIFRNDLYDRDISIDGIGITGRKIELVEGITM